MEAIGKAGKEDDKREYDEAFLHLPAKGLDH
jgi:hypothetical protein